MSSKPAIVEHNDRAFARARRAKEIKEVLQLRRRVQLVYKKR